LSICKQRYRTVSIHAPVRGATALACPPDLFFAEVFGPDEGWWEAGEEWAELREVVLQRHRETLPGIEERRPLLGLHPPVKGKG